MMALGLGLGLPFGGSASAVVAPTIPATQTVSFGSKTRVGFEGDPLSYTGVGTLSIAAGNGSGHWQIDGRNMLVPKNGAGVYDSAGPTFSGPYTLTVTDGAASSTVTANMLSAATGIREMYATAANPDDPAGDNFFTYGTQLGWLFRHTAFLDLGDTIWCRDGQFNPLDQNYFLEPQGGWAGSGRITVRSRTVDVGVDTYGLPRLQHGFKTGQLVLSGGDITYAIDFRDIWFYSNSPTTGQIASLFVVPTSAGDGYGIYNCRFELGPLVPFPSDGFGIKFQKNSTVNNCTFVGIGSCITGFSGLTAVGNVFYDLWSDCIQMNGTDHVITDNFGFNFKFATGAHPDGIQYLGLTTTGSAGDFLRNIFVRNVGTPGSSDAEGFLIAGDQGGGTLTGGNFRNNITYLTAGNAMVLGKIGNVDCSFNTCLSDPLADTGGTIPAALIYTAVAAANGTFKNNVSQGFDFSSQTGTVVNSDNVTLGLTLAAITVAFPNVPQTAGLGTLTSRTAVLHAFTPAQTLVASGGVKKSDSTYSGALFPAAPGQTIGAWNDGTVFNPSDPTWLAAHPPAT